MANYHKVGDVVVIEKVYELWYNVVHEPCCSCPDSSMNNPSYIDTLV
jgi:hypothetical protein